MSTLVGYDSSDEDDDVHSERPAKKPRLYSSDQDVAIAQRDTPPMLESTTTQPEIRIDPVNAIEGPIIAPTTVDPSETSAPHTPSSAPPSPYTTERQHMQTLTMPTHPNFSIPSSPSPPPRNSEEAATLAATTKKFERFLELKKQGTHFNARLEKSAALRNPRLLPKLMDFAGVGIEESYASTLSEELAVPVRWREEAYVENLVREGERREKKRKDGRSGVEFVKEGVRKSADSSAKSTPSSNREGGRGGRKSRFDQT